MTGSGLVETLRRRLESLRAARYLTFLLALVALVALDVVLEARVLRWLLPLGFVALVLAATPVSSSSRRSFRLALALLALPVLSSVARLIVPESLALRTASGVLAAVFLTFVAMAVFGDLFRTDRVTWDTLLGAATAYVLMGLVWGLLFAAVAESSPEAIRLPEIDAARLAGASGARRFTDYVFFSFVTLTTLGYGDVTPGTGLTRLMVVLEALGGQLYIAVVVARLVAMHLMESRR